MKLLFAFVSFVACGRGADATSRPIIGLVAQEISISLKESFPQHSSYIAASYVKAIESSAARVVPIVVNKSESYYRELLSSINGVVIPGGEATLAPGNPYYDTVSKIIKIAEQLNDENIQFPILSVCLGFEAMLLIDNKDDAKLLTQCNAVEENLSLKFVLPYQQTRYFSSLSVEQYNLLTQKNLTANHHHKCVTVQNFEQRPFLRNDWTITSTSTSFDNEQFIATIEHKKYPFFGLQFHPEKVTFEWGKQNRYKHSTEAVTANRFFYDRLVHFSRQNDQKFNDTNVEFQSLIYNCPVTYTDGRSKFFTQIYFDPLAEYSTEKRTADLLTKSTVV